ncbi:mandelate racemase/muconate lactonizing enzyme family protein [Acidisphaera sp. L21]|uniref:mandelate racemase/muconate lactonizing enzyme family protein n=1 Tax=Acidisphaera sp. L21 TaxID=1641851 RepID=UPI00131AD4F2|nr:mandelate racemase/muconate lactonizing enzyme family protein [Acidisphaera sp. L21]
MDGAAWNPVSRWHERRAPFIRLVAEDGSVGIGEGWSDQGKIAAFFDHLQQVSGWLLQQRCDDIDPIHATMFSSPSRLPWVAPAVGSAIDIALWDLRARRRVTPLHRLLGSTTGVVEVYASGGLYADGKFLNDLAAEMHGYAAEGFTAVKMKIGALPMADDLARVSVVRDAIGSGHRLMVDAVGQLSRATAPAWIDGLARLGVHAIQAPLPEGDIDGMAALQARGPLTVVAQEREHDPMVFRALIEQQAVGMLQFNPGLAGGVTGARALTAMANAAAIPVTLQCYSTAVMQAACWHIGAALPGVQSVENHQFHDSLNQALQPEMAIVREGQLRLGDQPGLGIDPALFDGSVPGPGTLERVFASSN